MDKRILIGAALLGGFIFYKKKKDEPELGRKVLDEIPTQQINEFSVGTAETPDPYFFNKNEAITPYETLSAGALPDDDKKKIIEAIKKEDNFQKGKFFAVQITSGIFTLSVGIAYIIKLLLDKTYGKIGGEFEKSASENLLPKIKDINQNFEPDDFNIYTNNKTQQKSLSEKFNESFRKFKNSVSNKIENIKDYISPDRLKNNVINAGNKQIIEKIRSLKDGIAREFYRDKLDNINRSYKMDKKESPEKAYKKLLKDIQDLLDQIGIKITRQEDDKPKNIFFSDLNPKGSITFLGENPLEQFHMVNPGFSGQDTEVYITENLEEAFYEQMQLESITYNIAYDSLNDVIVISTKESSTTTTEKEKPLEIEIEFEETKEKPSETVTIETQVMEETKEKPSETVTGEKPQETGFSDVVKKNVTYVNPPKPETPPTKVEKIPVVKTKKNNPPQPPKKNVNEKPLRSVEDIQYDIKIRPDVIKLIGLLKFYIENTKFENKTEKKTEIETIIKQLEFYKNNENEIVTKDFMRQIAEKIKSIANELFLPDIAYKNASGRTGKGTFELYFGNLSKNLEKY